MFRSPPAPEPAVVLAGRVLVGAAVVGAGARLAAAGVPDWEAKLFRLMNNTPHFYERPLWIPMQLGSLWGPVAVGAGIWRFRRDRRTALGVLGAGVLAWQLAKVIKNRVGRGRPWHEMDHIEHRAGTPSEGLGYVSGHTAVGAAMATVLRPHLSVGGRLVTYLAVMAIAFGRVHVSAHMPVDLVGGLGLGIAVGSAWELVSETAPTQHSRRQQQ